MYYLNMMNVTVTVKPIGRGAMYRTAFVGAVMVHSVHTHEVKIARVNGPALWYSLGSGRDHDGLWEIENVSVLRDRLRVSPGASPAVL